MKTILLTIGNVIGGCFNSGAKVVASLIAVAWAYLEPAVHLELVCIFAVMVDCLTAWRLNRRVRAKFPNAGADGKLKSSHMSKMITDLCVVFLCIKLAMDVDSYLLPHMGDLHLGQYVAAIFCLTTFVSILENESSCSDATWAKLIQKVVTNKVARHIDITEQELTETLTGNKNKDK